MRRICGASFLVLLLSISGLERGRTQPAVANSAPVYVTLWFDTEDYTSPEPDTIILPLCKILERQQIRATFKMIGEKARDLELKGQRDVIKALSRHDVGFHTTYHSQPPAVTAYLERLDWDDGVDEFQRREEKGFQDTRRILGRTPICYGQPGNTWAPQVYGVLRRWGVPLYLDEGTHVGLKGKPFYYCGILNVYDMADQSTRMGLEGAADYDKGAAAFEKIHQKLVQERGGLISIYYHPNEFDHTEFWDAVIWARGANPEKVAWKTAAKRTPQSRAQALEYFERYLVLMKKMPGVRFVTASEMLKLYADRSAAHSFNREEIEELARSLSPAITFRQTGGVYVSSAEAFSILLRWHLRKPGESSVRLISGVLGPTRREPGQTDANVERWEFRMACEDILDVLSRRGRIPNVVWIGSLPVTPGDFLATLAEEIVSGSAGQSVRIRRGNFTAAQFAADDSERIFSWIILPPGFHAPHVMDLAKLQCWSLKPAILGVAER